MWNRRKRGFTLIEIIIGLTVIAVLAAIAVPVLIAVTNDATERSTLANAVILCNAYNMYQQMYLDNRLPEGAPLNCIESALKKANLWPANITDDEVMASLKYITLVNGVAVASEPGAQQATSTLRQADNLEEAAQNVPQQLSSGLKINSADDGDTPLKPASSDFQQILSLLQ